jgi:hypothetical protein
VATNNKTQGEIVMFTFMVIGAVGLFLFFSALVTGNRPATTR